MLSVEQSDIQSVMDSSREPLVLTWEKVTQFSSRQTLLRSGLEIHSLELGVLTPEQYRYVARRTSQCERLFRRHLHKLLEQIPGILKQDPTAGLFTLPACGRLLKKASLCGILFEELAAHPEVSASSLCVEISGDILFEELEPVAAELERVQNMGVKIAFWELGDPFCPLLRLKDLPCDYVFLDRSLLSLPGGEEEGVLSALCGFLHGIRERLRIILPELPEDSWQTAERLGCDGASAPNEEVRG